MRRFYGPVTDLISTMGDAGGIKGCLRSAETGLFSLTGLTERALGEPSADSRCPVAPHPVPSS
jgi:hypothetical protein